jgi:hypothetical protein
VPVSKVDSKSNTGILQVSKYFVQLQLEDAKLSSEQYWYGLYRSDERKHFGSLIVWNPVLRFLDGNSMALAEILGCTLIVGEFCRCKFLG